MLFLVTIQCLLLAHCAALGATPVPRSVRLRALSRTPPCMMGRAEKRMAMKRAKKGTSVPRPGGRPAVVGAPQQRNDVLARDDVKARLREIPCFGVLAGGGVTAARSDAGFLQTDGATTMYLDNREAEQECERLASPRFRVEATTLDTVYFDPTTRLKPSDESLQQARTVPTTARAFAFEDVAVPLFCIDGLQTTDKTSRVSSLPLFFSKMELLEFAKQAGIASPSVLVADLPVVVRNMLEGPAGLLRETKFFPTAKALVAVDEQADQRTALFPGMGGTEAGDGNAPMDAPRDLFGGLKSRVGW